jgi:hypothetical protein
MRGDRLARLVVRGIHKCLFGQVADDGDALDLAFEIVVLIAYVELGRGEL